jgi:hypothetical protein
LDSLGVVIPVDFAGAVETLIAMFTVGSGNVGVSLVIQLLGWLDGWVVVSERAEFGVVGE